ncbi:XkdF-like putative serine protease domain-containing protein [Exiguobacterium sp. s183]|uniref:XkdF-like putative serine protease domain-containing protein n=1 Tax=Exiguobacterium sp. s183 TaxID=2751262 RepID=UPI001BE822B1|nr:XkdF-like putative serine protease domain-containing protein [Exiguobacterium sp. s183]
MGRITNLIPSHVSIVDKAANKRSFLLVKSDQQPNVEADVKLLKRDEAQQIVYGVVYEPDVVDAHGDFMDASEIEKAAHVFLKEFRNIDKQHDFTSKVGEVIESYIAPADFELGGQTVTKGTWMMAVKVVDDVWQSIQKGEYTGFSLAGYGNVEKAQETPQEPSEDVLTKEDTSFLSKLKKFFAPLLEHEQVQKEQGEEVMTMTKEELQTLVTDTVAEAVAKALAKQETPAEPASPQDEPEAVAEDVVKEETPAEDTTEQTELAKALERIAELEKQVDARPVAFSSGAEVTKTETPEKKSYLKHFG